jgi:hypothetical protein
MAPPPPLDTYACYALPHQTLVVVPVKFFLAAAIDQVTTRYLRRLGYHVSDYLFLDPVRYILLLSVYWAIHAFLECVVL